MKTFNQISQSAVYKADDISVSLTVCGGSYGGGSEVLIVSYQTITGSLSPGGHPGSYNGQDAYNDLLVIDENHNNKPQRYADQGGNEWDSRFACGIGLQRPADSASAERERERVWQIVSFAA